MADENVALITGQATYIDDVHDPLLQSAGHAIFVRSTSPHAYISVDVEAARRAPGVLCVATAADNTAWPTVAHAAIHPVRFAQPLLAEHKARFVGEPVAVVVATTREQAVDAAELVVVDYDELPPVLSADESTCRRRVAV